jgi:hypothetical protein
MIKNYPVSGENFPKNRYENSARDHPYQGLAGAEPK